MKLEMTAQQMLSLPDDVLDALASVNNTDATSLKAQAQGEILEQEMNASIDMISRVREDAIADVENAIRSAFTGNNDEGFWGRGEAFDKGFQFKLTMEWDPNMYELKTLFNKLGHTNGRKPARANGKRGKFPWSDEKVRGLGLKLGKKKGVGSGTQSAVVRMGMLIRTEDPEFMKGQRLTTDDTGVVAEKAKELFGETMSELGMTVETTIETTTESE